MDMVTFYPFQNVKELKFEDTERYIFTRIDNGVSLNNGDIYILYTYSTNEEQNTTATTIFPKRLKVEKNQ